jgi:AraC-like DNA-binding protein
MLLIDPAGDFFDLLAEPFHAGALFDCLPDVVYFVKNRRGEYVVVNRTLADRCAVRDKVELLGLTADQAFPPPHGKRYREQDEAILRTGVPIRDQLELHLYPSGRIGWCLTHKLALRGKDGGVVGLAGISRDVQPPDDAAEEYAPVAEVVRRVRERPAEKISVGELAAAVGLSPYHLDRRVRKLFRLTVGQLLLKLRMDEAARQLRETDRSMAAVAADCGYADQSAFARQFKASTGQTPGRYRRARSLAE